ncbi:MAG: glutamate-5-semialdehyde dehydrogenase [Oscillospiraceae bacterium]|nr:glutamate-5-semialdehyde dehydrogenase [Oscillospiraceae bacterium]
MLNLTEIGERAKKSATQLAVMLSGQKDRALLAIAKALEENTAPVLEANAADLAQAAENGMSVPLQDRLLLTKERLFGIAEAVRYVVGLEDPVGQVLGGGIRPNGLKITKRAVPFGVIGLIYESRPNVTVDCAVLCLKSGNACILRGSKDAVRSNIALVRIMRDAIEKEGLNPDAIQLVEDTSRETAAEMMRLNSFIDVLIPRGGAGLIATVVQNSTVPVIETGSGNCHFYVDESADLDMAADILHNAKTSRPGVCNAAEKLLVHKNCARAFLPMAAERLRTHNVELRACPRARDILGDACIPATDSDWSTEYEDYILGIKIVNAIGEAIEHINRYSTHHSDAIITSDYANSRLFCDSVDSAAVYVNASTRFTDGGEFGLGAEIGISTQKLHARGPMGLTHLVSYKYILEGSGQIR